MTHGHPPSLKLRRASHALVDTLIATGVLQSPHIIEAFRAIDRADFVPEHLQDQAYADIPLPLGRGQTISQPWTVAFMLERLQPLPGQIILDIGSGSGWQTALLAHIVSQASNGHVVALEVVPELCEQGQHNVARYTFLKRGIVDMQCQDATAGYPARAPFDRIIAAARVDNVPRAWQEQVKMGGRIVAPMGSSIVALSKLPGERWQQETYPGFAFVPFVQKMDEL
jgi:protein-L-isoaspartate(D-aspartate) O-methyltransferase